MLLVSIHDVAPRHLATVARMRADLYRWGADKVTLLAVPNFHGTEPLRHAPETTAWLRAQADAGDEIALHGYYHRQRRPLSGLVARLRGRLLTNGEAECLSLSDDESGRILGKGKELLEELLGRRVSGFVAPAWLEPRRFDHQLRRAGFGWHETGMYVERLPVSWQSRRRIRTPVLGFATRSRLREWAAIAWVRGLTPLLEHRMRRSKTPIRIALHPGDATSDDVMACAEDTIRYLARRWPTGTVADVLR